MTRIAAVLAAVALACAGATAASGASRTDFGVVGTEVPPISSSLGTFVGAAHGPIGGWGIQIRHEPLRTGPTVAITGGSLWLALRTGAALHAPVAGGSVTVRNAGARCTNQVYAVHVQLAGGSTFDGTLVHRRHSFFHRCVIYAATISGRASLSV
ncbi:MAG TPA: hypothetical protein VFU56_02005 [Gaiellaceae bacterium]|nr:hypothetical protein [Gaiellaceae bacterium]